MPEPFSEVHKNYVVIGVRFFRWGVFVQHNDPFNDCGHLHLGIVLGKTKFVITYDPDFYRLSFRRAPLAAV